MSLWRDRNVSQRTQHVSRGLVLLLAMGSAMAMSAHHRSAMAASASDTFVTVFEETCAGARKTFANAVEHAKQKGWSVVSPLSHAQLAAVMQKSADGMAQGKAEGHVTDFLHETFSKIVSGRPVHLVVSLTQSSIFDQIGCYLYDFDATAPVDRSAVTRALKIAPANVIDDAAIVTAVWGPPKKASGRLDTYLTYIPAGSPHAVQTGFTGVVLKTTTAAAKGTGKG